MEISKTTDTTVRFELEDGSFATLEIGEEYVIEDIESKTRNVGNGTKLMKEIIKYWKDNNNGEELTLFACGQDDTTDTNMLINWYSALGFEIDEELGSTSAGTFMKY